MKRTTARSRGNCLRIAVPLIAYALGACSAFASPEDADRLIAMSLEDLLSVEVTSVTKRSQRLSDTAAAVYVITQEDIRRSSANSIPELLRIVPGLSVARLDAHRWAVSARGYTGEFSNKLLVLIDGRSVYTPLFGGVYWNERMYPLQDIERIEVIRGPGAAIWGANAVNGIINIITKSAVDTQGGAVSGFISENDRGIDNVRFGAKTADGIAYRLYASVTDRDNSPPRFAGGDTFDTTTFGQVGFRTEWGAVGSDQFTIQGDINRGAEGASNDLSIRTPPFLVRQRDTSHISGGNVLARWEHPIDTQSEFSAQAYYDRTNRNEVFSDFSLETADVEGQYNNRWASNHQLISGVGLRWSRLAADRDAYASVDDSNWTQVIGSGFLHDEYDVVPERLKFILGTKLEYNEFTGTDVQPTAQVVWTPWSEWTLWASYARALRNPAFSDNGLRLPLQTFPSESGIPTEVGLFGDRGVDSEKVNSYQLGARWRAASWIDFDLVAFYSAYHDILQFYNGEPSFVADPDGMANPFGGYISVPIISDNLGSSHTYGGEFLVRFEPMKRWQVQASYSLAATHEDFNPEAVLIGEEGNTAPRNQASLRSLFSLTDTVELDGFLRYVSELAGHQIPSYTELDIRLGWRPNAHWDFSLFANNLLDTEHPEFEPTILGYAPTMVERSFGGRFAYRF